MASNIYLQSGGVNYYLSGSARTKYAGSGTPWTAQATTPFTIGMHDGEDYTPQAPQAALIFGGGPPFRHGQGLHYRTFPNVTEQITVQCYANSYDNAVALKQKLYQILNPTVTGHPCRLVVQPNGSTNTGATEILSADVQEDPRFIGAEKASFVARLKVNWVRRPFFAVGPSDSDETIVSNASIVNTGTGSPDNVEAFSAFSGELQNEGQPTIVTVIPGAGPFTIFYIATIQGRTYSTTGAAALSTSSTSGTQTALNAPSITNAMTALGVKARSLMRFTNNTSNVQIRVEVRATTSGTLLYAGKWITPTSGSATLYDMGEIPLDLFRKGFPGTSTLQLYIGYRSTNGASATTTLGYNEFLLYYDFCRVDANVSSSGSNTHLQLYSYPRNSRLYLPFGAPTAMVTNSSSAIFDDATVRGSFPRAIAGQSMYVAWMQANNVHATADGATLSVRQAPLYLTLRGAL